MIPFSLATSLQLLSLEIGCRQPCFIHTAFISLWCTPTLISHFSSLFLSLRSHACRYFVLVRCDGCVFASSCSSHYYLPAFVTMLSDVVCVESARIPRGICEDLIAHDAALRCTTLHYTALHCTAPHCVVHAHLPFVSHFSSLFLSFARACAVTLHLPA